MTVELQLSIEAPIYGPALNSQAGSPRSGLRDQRVRRDWGASTAGASAVEFALVAPMFFLLYFAVFDFARLFYAEMTLQNAVRQAGRYAVTGNHLPDPQRSGQSLSRVASITQVAQQAAMGLSVSGIQISSLGGGSGSAGGPGDTVTISLTTNLQLMTPIVAQYFPGGTYMFTVSVTFKNEPFPPANTS
jgi:Flp pilus assembly protein TadG